MLASIFHEPSQNSIGTYPTAVQQNLPSKNLPDKSEIIDALDDPCIQSQCQSCRKWPVFLSALLPATWWAALPSKTANLQSTMLFQFAHSNQAKVRGFVLTSAISRLIPKDKATLAIHVIWCCTKLDQCFIEASHHDIPIYWLFSLEIMMAVGIKILQTRFLVRLHTFSKWPVYEGSILFHCKRKQSWVKTRDLNSLRRLVVLVIASLKNNGNDLPAQYASLLFWETMHASNVLSGHSLPVTAYRHCSQAKFRWTDQISYAILSSV